MARLALARAFWLAFGVASVVGGRPAQAQSATAEPATAAPGAAAPGAAAPATAAPAEPATAAPATAATAAPATAAPATAAPATAAPATAAPATAAPATAAPGLAEPPVAEAAAETAPALGGIDVLASLSWGSSTMDVLRLKLSPYGASAGVDLGYTWSSGFRLGGYVGYSLGRSVSQIYDPVVGRTLDLTADTSSLNAGLSVGYDVPIYCLVLRYALGFGATSMNWDFGSTTPRIARYSDSPIVGVHVAPGASLLWRSGLFEGGLGFRYLVQANGAIPSGFLGDLLVGVRL
jgi:hypothetical protein